jgi:N-acetylmuramoyl-L-alanine amidase
MFLYKDVSRDTALTAMSKRTLPRRGIVLHETAGRDSLAWLQRHEADPRKRSSADFLISRDGDIYQICAAYQYTFHSGKARWKLYQELDGSINQGFYGIEFENMPELGQVLTTEQYIAGAGLMRVLIARADLPLTNICGHYECALPLGRKQDPATLNWAMLTDELLSPSPEFTYFRWPRVMP